MIWCFVPKVAAGSSIGRPWRSMRRLANWCSCRRGRSSTQKQRESPPKNKYHHIYLGRHSQADQNLREEKNGHDQRQGRVWCHKNRLKLEGRILRLPSCRKSHEEGVKRLKRRRVRSQRGPPLREEGSERDVRLLREDVQRSLHREASGELREEEGEGAREGEEEDWQEMSVDRWMVRLFFVWAL